ncbi:hypothetical protein [Mycobacterium hubeiense]|uniref:hypothetical protein n=1 Tax=Mycobacterium hubeiense TaxID=1867256 RepID=UPI000C7F6BD6|nr:hypothetical protein [Mycobacterium sp. QGD 101]
MIDRAELRSLVREVVREAVSGVTPPPTPSAPTAAPAPPTPAPTGPLAADEKTRTDTVRIASDADLDGFVRRLLKLFENPKTRTDLRTGRLRFRLAGASGANGSHRVDSGVVTERHIADIATDGGSLVLGRRAVLTPLAREKARALGISIQKERK